MNRRNFLLSAAGAGLGIFVPKPIISYFDIQNSPLEPTTVFGHVVWGRAWGYLEHTPEGWVRLEGDRLFRWASSPCSRSTPTPQQAARFYPRLTMISDPLYLKQRARQMKIGQNPENVWTLLAFKGYTGILAIYTFLPWENGDWISYRSNSPPVLPQNPKISGG